MIMKSLFYTTISISLILLHVQPARTDFNPAGFLLGSIQNVTRGATSFISDSIQKQKDIILQAKDTAAGYVLYMVAGPKRMLNDAKHATIDYIDSTASKGMELKIRSLLDMVRTYMPYGIPALDLPVLEPLKIEHMDFATSNKDIGNISTSIDNVTVTRLSTFKVDHVRLTIIDEVSLALNLSVPMIEANGMYRALGSMGKLFEINGNGPFNLEAYGAKVYLHTVLGYKSGTMYVKHLDIDFSIESLNAVFENLFPNQEVDITVNKVLSGMAPEILEVIKPELRPKLVEIITQRINAAVARLTMPNIIGILTGTTNIQSFSNWTVPQFSL